MILPRSSYEYDVAEIACAKLGRLDVMDKVKICISKSYRILHNDTISLGNVIIVLDEKVKVYPKIRLYPNFRELSQQAKNKIIEHEICHIIDGTQQNDINLENGGHGTTFKILMLKLGYNEVNIEPQLMGIAPITLNCIINRFSDNKLKVILTHKNNHRYYRRVS